MTTLPLKSLRCLPASSEPTSVTEESVVFPSHLKSLLINGPSSEWVFDPGTAEPGGVLLVLSQCLIEFRHLQKEHKLMSFSI